MISVLLTVASDMIRSLVGESFVISNTFSMLFVVPVCSIDFSRNLLFEGGQ